MRRTLLSRALLGVGAVLGAYVALVAHPQPLFAHSLRRGNIVLHARQPFPPEAEALLDDALARVRRSPLYVEQRVHHAFLCDTPALFALFALHQYRSGAIANTWLDGNVFIRPANLKRGRVIGHSGAEKGGERTLAYYLAHEVTHAMSVDQVGRLGYARLSAFQVEGYADYVAFGVLVDVERGRGELIAGSRDMDPHLSGHYDRYRLLVGYLLQARGLSVEELLRQPLDRLAIEAQLRDLSSAGTPGGSAPK